MQGRLMHLRRRRPPAIIILRNMLLPPTRALSEAAPVVRSNANATGAEMISPSRDIDESNVSAAIARVST
jgi:hypothetical protein